MRIACFRRGLKHGIATLNKSDPEYVLTRFGRFGKSKSHLRFGFSEELYENIVRSKSIAKANPKAGSSDDPVDGDFADGASGVGRKD